MTRAHPISTADQDTPTLAARAGSRIAKAWRAYWQRRARRATVELLHSLDDRTLHDIGVSRNEIAVASSTAGTAIARAATTSPGGSGTRAGDRQPSHLGSWKGRRAATLFGQT